MATISLSDPYFEVANYSQVTSRTCFFFFSLSPPFVFLVVGGRGLLWLLWASLSLSLFWVVRCVVCMNANIRQREGVAYETAPPNVIVTIVFGD